MSLKKSISLLLGFTISLFLSAGLLPIADTVQVHLLLEATTPSYIQFSYDTGFGYGFLQSKYLTPKAIAGTDSNLMEIRAWLPMLPLKELTISSPIGAYRFTSGTLSSDNASENIDIGTLNESGKLILSEDALERIQGEPSPSKHYLRSSPLILAFSLTYLGYLLLANLKYLKINLLRTYGLPISAGLIFLLYTGGSSSYLPINFNLSGDLNSSGYNTVSILSLETNGVYHKHNNFLVLLDDLENASLKLSTKGPNNKERIYTKEELYNLPAITAEKNTSSAILYNESGALLDITTLLNDMGTLRIIRTIHSNAPPPPYTHT